MGAPERAWYRQGQALIDEIAGAKPAMGSVEAWCVGQVGFVFKGEKTVCIDPVFNDMTDGAGRTVRRYAPPFAVGALCADYVLCTHGHADHMALPTLTAMAAANPAMQILVPAGCVEELHAACVAREQIIGMTAGESISLPGLTVTPVQAAHPVHAVDAQGRDLALCLMLEINGVKLLHMGDTYLTDQLLADVLALPRPDVFFTPINGGDYFRTARDCIGNLDPRESAHLSVLLHAGVAVPTHYDMIFGNTRDPFEFVQLLWEENPAARFRIPALGEKLIFFAGE